MNFAQNLGKQLQSQKVLSNCSMYTGWDTERFIHSNYCMSPH